MRFVQILLICVLLSPLSPALAQQQGSACSTANSTLFPSYMGWASSKVFVCDGSVLQTLLAFTGSPMRLGVGDTTPDHLLDVGGNLGLDASSYINFGDTDGTSGYGIRDNGGTIECKNSGGSWSACSGGGSSSPPSAETIAGAATITANACGTIKRVNAGSNVTTNTTNTFTNGTTAGCCMDVVNVDTTDTITLDANANFKTIGGADQALAPYSAVRACSDGSTWYQMNPVAVNQ